MLYMFRATVFPSSGGQLYECNFWYNHSVSGRPVCRSRRNHFLLDLHTGFFFVVPLFFKTLVAGGRSINVSDRTMYGAFTVETRDHKRVFVFRLYEYKTCRNIFQINVLEFSKIYNRVACQYGEDVRVKKIYRCRL
jgi:hypothetical protein